MKGERTHSLFSNFSEHILFLFSCLTHLSSNLVPSKKPCIERGEYTFSLFRTHSLPVHLSDTSLLVSSKDPCMERRENTFSLLKFLGTHSLPVLLSHTSLLNLVSTKEPCIERGENTFSPLKFSEHVLSIVSCLAHLFFISV